MPVSEGKRTALSIAINELKEIDLDKRCDLHNLGSFHNNTLRVRLFGNDAVFHNSNFNLTIKDSPHEVRINQHILFLHYLQSELPVTPTGELISFRQLPGGQFYLDPFLSRTIRPLVKYIGNDTGKLKRQLEVFDWEPLGIGDLGAKIHAVGNIFITLIYYKGDDEFPPGADILFDSSIMKAFNTEDVSVAVSEICLGLLKQ